MRGWEGETSPCELPPDACMHYQGYEANPTFPCCGFCFLLAVRIGFSENGWAHRLSALGHGIFAVTLYSDCCVVKLASKARNRCRLIVFGLLV